jgi:hypothetical protein
MTPPAHAYADLFPLLDSDAGCWGLPNFLCRDILKPRFQNVPAETQH